MAPSQQFFLLLMPFPCCWAGKFVDWMDTKKGFLWAIGIWSAGAVLHAFCGIAASGMITGNWLFSFSASAEALKTVADISKITTVSVTLFVFARIVLALGEAGNFPAAIKATAEYFPKRARGFATSIFNAGATIGALAAPLTIPFIAKAYGWEMAFIIIGGLGFIWMGFWIFMYKKPEVHPKVNAAELAYFQQDDHANPEEKVLHTKRISFAQARTDTCPHRTILRVAILCFHRQLPASILVISNSRSG